MKTSIYIPVSNKSINRLYTIVEMYNVAEVRPDEIIINACGIDDEVSLGILRQIHDRKHDNVKIYARKTFDSIPDNSNYAKALTSGDLVMFHDPNVLPSTKRVDIVKKYFENHDILVLHHIGYTVDLYLDEKMVVDTTRVVQSSDLYSRYFPFRIKTDAWSFTRRYGQEFGVIGLDINSVCVRKEVLSENSWKNDYECEIYRGRKDGFGYEFALQNLYKYNKSDILNIPLTIIK